jgi:hypothetical protein
VTTAADTDQAQLDAMRAELAELTPDQLLNQLDSVAADLDTVEARRAQLYLLRLAIFQVARAQQPPITQRELAERARVTEPAVIQALRKAAKAAKEQNGA